MSVTPFPQPRYEADIVELGGGMFRVPGDTLTWKSSVPIRSTNTPISWHAR